jgi:hypothetical protein
MRQSLYVLENPIGIEPLDCIDNSAMKGSPSIPQQAAVSYLVGERMLEGVFTIGKESCFVEKFGYRRGIPSSSKKLSAFVEKARLADACLADDCHHLSAPDGC